MAGDKVSVHRLGRKAFKRYTVFGEELIFTTHRHWIVLVEPVVTVVVSLPVVGWAMMTLATSMEVVSGLALLWIVLVLRLVYRVVEWHETWFASTTRRLLYQYGLFSKTVAMMPLEKVTDMKYERSPWGLVLGYGQFIMESAGQHQALRSIVFIPKPDLHYRALVAALFGTKGVPPQEEDLEEVPEIPDYVGFTDTQTGPVQAYAVDEWEDPWESHSPPSYPPTAPTTKAPPTAPTAAAAVDDDVQTQVISREQLLHELREDD
jgi:hypothetical protein